MTSAEVFADAFGRVRGIVESVVRGLSVDELTYRVDDRANSIAWLVWHLTRIQDDHVAEVAGTEQLWITTWAERFALPLDPYDTGYGHSSQQVVAVVAGARMLIEYHDEVHEATLRFVEDLTDRDLDRVVDTRWDPPVTLGVRLVSVVADGLEHAGQAALIRGILERNRSG